ncbi:hypothetical protein ABIA31_009327 [Catenulispora sp. MAP5-51]|uniref:hypothetical protein n=1 Tax=Catenulispora sp. MAP5-51 TaxID=3156298 RepID=UPI003518F8F1
MTDDTAGSGDQGPRTALHAAAQIGLGGSELREECWNEIAAPVRDRLKELAAPVAYWWARPDSSHARQAPKAAVLGERGLYFAEPRPGRRRHPEYRISGYDFVSGSLTLDDVEHTPAAVDDPPSGATGPGARSDVSYAPDIGLLPDLKGILGNLPPRAQQLLQAPFGTGQRVDRQEFYYEGWPHHLYIFVLFLAGAEDLTIATGTKLIPDGHSDRTAHWSLHIYRALVRKAVV